MLLLTLMLSRITCETPKGVSVIEVAVLLALYAHCAYWIDALQVSEG